MSGCFPFPTDSLADSSVATLAVPQMTPGIPFRGIRVCRQRLYLTVLNVDQKGRQGQQTGVSNALTKKLPNDWLLKIFLLECLSGNSSTTVSLRCAPNEDGGLSLPYLADKRFSRTCACISSGVVVLVRSPSEQHSAGGCGLN